MTFIHYRIGAAEIASISKQTAYEGGAAAGGVVPVPAIPGGGGMKRGIYATAKDMKDINTGK